jgi:hypothetical protein
VHDPILAPITDGVQVEAGYGVTADRLLALLTNEAFIRARLEKFGGVGTPAITASAAGVDVAETRQLPLQQVPRAFRRFVGDGRFVETTRWDLAQARATWTVDTRSAPIDLSGTHALTGTSDGCLHVVTADVKVHLPIGRHRLTRLVETHLRDLIRAEQDFAVSWLGGRKHSS